MQSHPMWVRGLKPNVIGWPLKKYCVASYVGAWIETCTDRSPHQSETVASYVGAWIETQYRHQYSQSHVVASYVGAWIETDDER